MLGERRGDVAAEACSRRGQLAKNARGAPDGRVDGLEGGGSGAAAGGGGAAAGARRQRSKWSRKGCRDRRW